MQLTLQRGRKRIDIVGQTFGQWEVLRYVPARKPGSFYDCQCECGRVKEIKGQSLRDGVSPQCECRSDQI